MPVRVMGVGLMGMRVPPRFVSVAMAVRPRRHRLVHMDVVTIVVGMGVFVLQRIVHMFVTSGPAGP